MSVSEDSQTSRRRKTRSSDSRKVNAVLLNRGTSGSDVLPMAVYGLR